MIKNKLIYIALLLIFFACTKKENDILPELDFSLSKDTVLTGENISYSCLLKNGYSQLLWNFEGGTPSSSKDPNPFITYNKEGKYKVSLSVTLDSHTLQKDTFINVVSTKVYIQADKDTISFGDTVNFKIISQNFKPTRFKIRYKNSTDNYIHEIEYISSTIFLYFEDVGLQRIDFYAIDYYGRTDSAKYTIFVKDDRIKITGSIIKPENYKIDFFIITITEPLNAFTYLASIDTSLNYEVLMPKFFLGRNLPLEASFGYKKLPDEKLNQLIIIKRFDIKEITFIDWTLP